jgi:hypothetical protein
MMGHQFVRGGMLSGMRSTPAEETGEELTRSAGAVLAYAGSPLMSIITVSGYPEDGESSGKAFDMLFLLKVHLVQYYNCSTKESMSCKVSYFAVEIRHCSYFNGVTMSLFLPEREELAKHTWHIETTHAPTIDAIKSLLGAGEIKREPMIYNGNSKMAFLVPFAVAEHLADNRPKQGYDFIPYHKPENKPTLVWKMKSTKAALTIKNMSHLFGNNGGTPARELRKAARMKQSLRGSSV